MGDYRIDNPLVPSDYAGVTAPVGENNGPAEASLPGASPLVRDVFPDEATIRDWLLRYLAVLLQLPETDISREDPLAMYGLDSSAAVGMAGDLSVWLALKLEADLLYQYPTVDMLSAHLAARGAAA
jgi:acyl carrier protein